MMSAPYVAALSATLALAAGAQALAQGVTQGPPAVVYDQRSDPAYQAQQEQYRDQQSRYQAGRDTYLIQQDRYRRDRDAYLAARGAYDARYGVGSYDRYRVDWYRPYASSPCERAARGNAATGGVIGALAGAAIGSNVAARNARTEGAVLGALVGGALGANVGRASAQCDGRGYYFRRDQTVAYREDWDGPTDPYFVSRGCRLAAAPAYHDGVTDFRYVRVCPDRQGRYRITG